MTPGAGSCREGPPGPPRSLLAVPGDRSIHAEWDPPDSDGGSALTGYIVRWKSGTQQYHSSREIRTDETEADIAGLLAGLLNGIAYDIAVTAANDTGDSEPAQAHSVVPRTRPGPPRNLGATPADRAVAVEWDPPADNGGDPVDAYTLTWTTGTTTSRPTRVTATSHTIRGLANGATYDIAVTAANDAGDSEPAHAGAVPRTVAQPPSITGADPGGDQITVRWNPPGDSGGNPVSEYRLRWRTSTQSFTDADWPPDHTAAGITATSHTITGLQADTGYRIQAAAVNDAGASRWSALQSASTLTALSSPTSLEATPGDTTIALRWSPPQRTTGLTVTGYLVQWKSGTQQYSTTQRNHQAAASTTSHTIGGLVNGTPYDIAVTALSADNTGGTSQATAIVPRTTPGAPRNLRADIGPRTVSLRWERPQDLGGGSVTHYTVTWSSGTQLVGTRNVTVTAGDRRITVHWSQPGDGGADIIGYTMRWYDLDDQEFTYVENISRSATSHTLTDREEGTIYYAQIVAYNVVGLGAWSDRETIVLPSLPEQPASVQVDSGNRTLSITWDKPDFDGRAPVTAYRIQWRTDDQPYSDQRTHSRAVAAGDPATTFTWDLTGLDNGTRYWVQVAAVNAKGTGQHTAEASAVPLSVPGQPANFAVQPRHQALEVTWDAPSDDGGDDITGYKIQWRTGTDDFNTPVTLHASARGHEITPLDNGTRYDIVVAAVNSVGDSAQATGSAAPAQASTPAAPTVSIEPRDRGLKVTVEAAATNDRGTGPALELTAAPSAASGVPTAPVEPAALAGDAALLVSWSPPESDTVEVTGYRVSWKGPGEDYHTDREATVDAAATHHTIADLTNGARYDVRIIATSDGGDGAASTIHATPAAAPGPVRDMVVVVRSTNTALLSWLPPENDGGAEIEHYQIRHA